MPSNPTCAGTWRSPTLVRPVDAPAVFHSLSTSGTRRGPVYTMLSILHREVQKRSLTVVTDGGVDIGAPAGDFEFIYPHGVVDERGKLYVVWGEPDTMLSRSIGAWMITSVRGIWTATYDPTTKSWSPPALLHRTRASRITWARGNPVSWSAGRATIAAAVSHGDTPMGAGPSGPGFVLLIDPITRRVDSVTVASQERPVHAAAVRANGADLLAVAGAVVNADNDVRVVRGTDVGQSAELSLPRAAQVQGVRLFDDGARGVHLVWLEHVADGSVLVHVGRDARTGKWSRPEEYALHRGTGNERYALDACGVIHVILEMQSDDGAYGLSALRFDNGWQAPTRLYEGLFPRNADIAAFADGSMMLAFQGNLSGTKGGSLVGRYAP
jgi:hypothetical protein